MKNYELDVEQVEAIRRSVRQRKEYLTKLIQDIDFTYKREAVAELREDLVNELNIIRKLLAHNLLR